MNNLWQDLDKITSLLRPEGPKLLMLDFDGTLSPIANTPDQAELPAETKILLQKLKGKKGVHLAIISGRSLKDLKTKTGLSNIIYAGNHGLQAQIYNRKYSFPLNKETLKTLAEIKSKLKQLASQFDGLLIEDKRLILSFHFRKVAAGKIPKLKLLFNRILEPSKKDGLVNIVTGKKVWEIRPKVEWDKGRFALLLIDEIKKIAKKPPVTLYIGDDATDEDVFRRVENAITIRVGKGRKTKARYYLKNTKEVVKFLQEIKIVS